MLIPFYLNASLNSSSCLFAFGHLRFATVRFAWLWLSDLIVADAFSPAMVHGPHMKTDASGLRVLYVITLWSVSRSIRSNVADALASAECVSELKTS